MGASRALTVPEIAARGDVSACVAERGLEALDEKDLGLRAVCRGTYWVFYLAGLDGPSRAPPPAPPPPDPQRSLFDLVSDASVGPAEAERNRSMPTFSKRPESSYIPPPPGSHAAVCVDVIDHGLVETPYGKKLQISLRWQVADTMPNGKRFAVTQRYTNSLDLKSKLHDHLVSWRGRAFTEAELAGQGFDLDRVIGAPCLLNIAHETGKDGKTWGRVKAVMALPKGLPRLTIADDYVRVKDRPKDAKAAEPEPALAPLPEDELETPAPDPEPEPEPEADDDLPF